MQKGNVVENSYAVRGADSFDNSMSKGFIAGAKNIDVAGNGGLQDRVVVRVTDNGCRNLRWLRQNAGRLQESKVLSYGSFRQWPSSLNVRVGQDTLHLDQNGRRKDKHMRSRYDGHKQIAGKTLG